LGPLYDLFIAIKRERLSHEFGDAVVDPTMVAVVKSTEVEMGDVLDDLHLHNDCCRVRMMSQVEFKEVY
jgi:DNA-directed RNA polymerase subunit N (RpoN/RPB10)